MSDKIKWQGYEWLSQERWGNIHPEKPECWYDPSAIEITADETLRLKARPNPKEFTITTIGPDGTEKITSPVGIGLISCTEKFEYGKFEIEAKLPNGPYAWPAFWMWSFETYPPEIDVIEGYSNKRSSYFNWRHDMLIGRFWRVKSNIHLEDKVKCATKGGMNEDGTYRWQLGAKAGWLGFKSPSKRFNKYGVEWYPDQIRILFNDKCVRKITDKAVLDQMVGKTMNVIINNSILPEYINTNMPEHEMIVKNFKYTKF
jgi:hypothetical protein